MHWRFIEKKLTHDISQRHQQRRQMITDQEPK